MKVISIFNFLKFFFLFRFLVYYVFVQIKVIVDDFGLFYECVMLVLKIMFCVEFVIVMFFMDGLWVEL